MCVYSQCVVYHPCLNGLVHYNNHGPFIMNYLTFNLRFRTPSLMGPLVGVVLKLYTCFKHMSCISNVSLYKYMRIMVVDFYQNLEYSFVTIPYKGVGIFYCVCIWHMLIISCTCCFYLTLG